MGLIVMAFCFMCVVGIIVAPPNKQQSTVQKGPPEQDRLIAEIEVQAPPLPEFSENDYKHDFTKDDYATIPDGAKSETRTEIIKSEFTDINGKPETMEGYVERSGRFVQHGAFTTWTDETKTKKLRIGTMLNGQRHGVITYFYPNGQRQTEMPSVNGKYHGIRRGWHENGQPSFEQYWIDGLRHGRFRGWYDIGTPEEDEAWVSGKLHGVSKHWFKDGRLASIDCFRNGKRNGKIWSQNEDGSLGETGEWEEGKPKGRCRFQFLGPDKTSYYVEVSDEAWKGGTINEYIARMYYHMLRDRPDLGLQFDPKLKIATYFAPHSAAFFERFGEPTQRVTDFEKAPAGAPGFIQDKYQIWSYACRDGLLKLRVQPTQSGNLMVTSHWRDNP